MQKIRIVMGDHLMGRGHGKVYIDDKEIEKISRLHFEASANGLNILDLTLFVPNIEIEAHEAVVRTEKTSDYVNYVINGTRVYDPRRDTTKDQSSPRTRTFSSLKNMFNFWTNDLGKNEAPRASVKPIKAEDSDEPLTMTVVAIDGDTDVNSAKLVKLKITGASESEKVMGVGHTLHFNFVPPSDA
jgi:hypothetical protein